MKFYSTNNKTTLTSLKDPILQALAADNGLYMPESIPLMPTNLFVRIHEMDFREIALAVAEKFTADDIPSNELQWIIEDTITFEAPLVPVDNNISALELFHGPTMAFKDFGARFM